MSRIKRVIKNEQLMAKNVHCAMSRDKRRMSSFAIQVPLDKTDIS